MGNWDVDENGVRGFHMPEVKILQNKKGATDIWVHGKRLERCYSVSYEQSTETIPVFRFEVYGSPNIEMDHAGVIIVVNPDSIPNMIEAIDYTLDAEDISPSESWESIREKLHVAINAE